ncbi:MAG: Na-translocating system protein MpsB [Actinomycetota bacterium]|nr:Na-translocating system protein MpsB [Actinomycetota bacterium]
MRSLKYTPFVIGFAYIATTAVLSALGSRTRTLALQLSSGQPILGISFNLSRALFVVLVTIIANTVFAYADGTMRSEPNVKKFLYSSSIFFLSTFAMVFSPSLIQFSIATTISTLALGYATFLIPFQDRSKRPRYPWHLHIGDLLLVAVSAATNGHPNQKLTQITLIIWTFSRAGLLPFSKWVVASVNAPTAASVMLHGGYVNAPAIALIYFGNYQSLDKRILVAIVILAIATIIWSSLAKSYAKDVKGRLAVSTCGQMSFMVLEILSGLPVLGLFHAVGHGLFKSYLLYDAPSDPFNKSELISDKATSNRKSASSKIFKSRNPLRAVASGVVAIAVMTVATIATGKITPVNLSSLIPESVGFGIALYVAISVSFGHKDRVGASTLARTLAASIIVAPWLIFIAISKVAANHYTNLESVHLGIWIPTLLSLIAPVAIKRSVKIDKLALGHILHRSYAASMNALVYHGKLSRARSLAISKDNIDQANLSSVNLGIERVTSTIALSLPTVNFVAVNPFQSQIEKNFLDITTPNRDLPLPSLATLADLYSKGEISSEQIPAAVEDTLALYPELVPQQLQTKSALESATKSLLATTSSTVKWEHVGSARSSRTGASFDELTEEVSILLMDALLEGGRVVDEDNAIALRILELTLGHDFATLVKGKCTNNDELLELMTHKIAHIANLLGASSNNQVSQLVEATNTIIPGWLTLMNRSNEGGIGEGRRDLAVAAITFALLFTELVVGINYRDVCKDESKPTSESTDALANATKNDRHMATDDIVGELAPKEDAVRIVAQRALELTYQVGLVSKISNNAVSGPLDRTNSIDMLFCIDVRSEPMRRMIEEDFSDVRTFGLAGFFGLPFRVRQAKPSTLRAPILLDPIRWASSKRVVSDSEELLNDIAASYELLDNVPSLSLISAEVIGGYMGIASFLKTNLPNFFAKIRNGKATQKADIEALRSIELEEMEDEELEEITYLMATTLKSIGLVKDFADTVVLVGHHSTNTNQLHRMAYQCGACGGNSGAENATLVSKLLNHREIRERLATYGVQIPTTTKFISAVHDTTRANIDIVSEIDDTTTVTLGLIKLVSEINQATTKTSNFSNLNGLSRQGDVRSNWWFEGWPEMGLANAASFIIAPREMTRGLDLGGRSFLQSYDLRFDPDGATLESIMSAPMIVGEMISKSYFFAALDESVITSNKTILNPISNLGAISGTSGDLIGGLARQAYTSPQGRIAHLPLRLTGVIYANKETVASIISKNRLLKDTIMNRWMHLLVLDSSDGRFYDVHNLIANSLGDFGDDQVTTNPSFEPTA